MKEIPLKLGSRLRLKKETNDTVSTILSIHPPFQAGRKKIAYSILFAGVNLTLDKKEIDKLFVSEEESVSETESFIDKYKETLGITINEQIAKNPGKSFDNNIVNATKIFSDETKLYRKSNVKKLNKLVEKKKENKKTKEKQEKKNA